MRKKFSSLVDYIDSIDKFFFILKKFKDMEEFQDNSAKFILLVSQSSEDDFDVILNNIKNKYSRKFAVIDKKIESRGNEVLYRLEITRKFYWKSKFRLLPGKCLFYLNKNDNYLIVFTDHSTDFAVNALMAFTNKLYPYFARVIIPHFFIVNLIEKLEQEGYECISSILSKKKWWERATPIMGEKPSSGVEFPVGIEFQKVLEQLRNENSTINAIMLAVLTDTTPILRFYVSRKGLVQYISGDFEFFQKRILKSTIDYGIDTILKFKDKNRDIEEIKPLRVRFSGLEEFGAREVISRFIVAIKSNRNFSTTILHQGNPYFDANICDLSDGSTFNLLLFNKLDNYELIIVPQYVASPTSLMGFFETLFTNFGEGDIEEYSSG